MKKVVFFLYQLFIFAPIFILATIATAITVMIGCLVSKNSFWRYNPPRYWSKLACRLTLSKIKVTRKGTIDPKQSYVFVANHQGAFDIFLIYGYLGQNIKWMQKQELRKIPFVGKASEIAGHIFVDHSSLRSMLNSIDKAKSELTDGASVTIFPEGARTRTGKMDSFKKGAFVIAKQMGLPIVPITVNGPYDVMKINTYLINPSKMELVIHDLIPAETVEKESMNVLMDKCQSIIYSGLWEKYK
ncbi:1-acyl-sn-glycerol-3-phosphate acyltransferase [Prevotella sp. 10(H)]|uniref:lysophospholipid acyltransferase family protein n=1 Tax=Prevotella sp. 10(H) TaxID=1158294 RepID=UPI0004A713BB|nr:lysophospholipid acyltransferase family protein [Prevotella sp. 10(H)]